MAHFYVDNVKLLALAAVWVAVVLACSWIPAYPVLGTSAVITLSSILFSSLTAPMLGPLWGTVAGLAFGLAVPILNPGTSIGPLTFLGPTVAALVSGLVLFGRWKEALLVFGVEVIVWFLHPFAWYEAMPFITWSYWVVLAFIVVKPLRSWIVDSIVKVEPVKLTIALWCLAWVARISDVANGNNIFVWTLGWGTPELYPFWAPMTVYYAIADSLNCLAGAIIAAALLITLKKANLRATAIDYLADKRQKMQEHK